MQSQKNNLKFVSYDIVFQEVPGEVSLGISISNCPYKCVGCHSSWLRKNIGTKLDISSLSKILKEYNNNITCVCFLGGDSNPEQINELAAFVKTFGLKSAWYSGSESISKYIDIQNFDYIKIGSYKSSLGNLKSPKTNQKIFKNISGNLVEIDIAGNLK